jgi:uncharacterized protein UPF0175
MYFTVQMSWVDYNENITHDNVLCHGRLDAAETEDYPAFMNVTLSIPDDLAARLSAGGDDISRRALEALAVEEYQAGRLTRPELRRLLGFSTRAELDGFLKQRGFDESITIAEFERDQRDLDRLGV